MWIAGLFLTTAIAFLLMCLRGFQAGLKEKRYIWVILVKVEKQHATSIPHRKSRPEAFPKAA